MKSHTLLAAGAFSLALGMSGAFAQTQSSQVQATGNQQAAPSQKPAPEATTAARTGQNASNDSSKVGNEQAAPSQAPASQATAAATKQKP